MGGGLRFTHYEVVACVNRRDQAKRTNQGRSRISANSFSKYDDCEAITSKDHDKMSPYRLGATITS